VDGAYHDVDSSALAFEIACARRSVSAAEAASLCYRADHEVECVTPEDYTGSVIGDMNFAARGQTQARTCAVQYAKSSNRWCAHEHGLLCE